MEGWGWVRNFAHLTQVVAHKVWILCQVDRLQRKLSETLPAIDVLCRHRSFLG